MHVEQVLVDVPRATMIQMGGTVHDLAEAELCYAPQYGSAKDPVNVAGMMAGNALRGVNALNLSGGYTTWRSMHDAGEA
jgi:hypothetical protein